WRECEIPIVHSRRHPQIAPEDCVAVHNVVRFRVHKTQQELPCLPQFLAHHRTTPLQTRHRSGRRQRGSLSSSVSSAHVCVSDLSTSKATGKRIRQLPITLDKLR